ncbi:MAG TPA: hypothetical protein VKV17_00330 [Bryobacteraceae bacterium]|nr:hypothetical protein [Bryobacteraceae bacterium]
MLVIALVSTIWAWAVPATLAAGMIAILVELVNLVGGAPWYVWVLLSPSLYVVWLVLFLYFCGKMIGPIGRRYPKPRYGVIPGTPMTKFRTVFAGAFRVQIVESLPLVSFLQSAMWGRELVLRSYAPSMHCGEGVQSTARITDPDLTFLGDGVSLGAGSTIAAHFWSNLPSGKRVFVTAPVKIGARAMIGGYCVVSMGCQIGEDAIIQPHSYLPPHTKVPAREIWGGCPAVFIQKRTFGKENAAAAAGK